MSDVLGSTARPDEAFVIQTLRLATIPLGERHLRETIAEFVAHYHGERNHQGLGNALIDSAPPQRAGGPVRRHQRVGGLLSYYYRTAA